MNNYYQYFDEIKTKITDYPLEITKGTKKMIKDYNLKAKKSRNQMIEDYINQFTKEKGLIKEELIKRKNNLFPKSVSEEIKINENKLALLKKVIRYNNPYNDTYDKASYITFISKIDDIENSNLKEINDTLLYIINKFKKSNVRLTLDDFNYTMYTKEYMKSFLDNIDNEDFDNVMIEKFDQLYWNCPNLLTHLKLNILFLMFKYNKNIENYCIERKESLFKQSETNIDNYKDKYKNCFIELLESINHDSYLNIEKFISNKLKIDEYLVSSPVRDSKYKRFIEDFYSLSDINKENFYSNIISLRNIINEVEKYRLYEKIVEDIKNIYNNKKDKNKNNYLNILKNIKKEEKQKDKLLKNYYKLLNKKNQNYNKINIIKNDLNLKINLIENLYKDLEKSRIDNKILTNINEGSTIYDALFLAVSFYSYIKNIIIKEYNIKDINEIDNIIKELEDFLYNPNNIIIKKISLFNEHNLEYMIINKCKLLNINITKEDLLENIDSIKNDLDMLITIHNINNSNITFEDIKFIYEVNKI